MTAHPNGSMASSARKVWQSALAGTLATFPMTLFMLATQRFLPKGQRYDLPPEIITKDLARRAHIKPFLDKQQIRVATLISHFGYGAAMGALYFPLERKRRVLAPLQGLLYGLLVWAGSYLGLVPLLRSSAAGHREPGQRNLMMIAAHVLWGTITGIITDVLINKETKISRAKAKEM